MNYDHNIDINGTQQNIRVYGKHESNPVILFLHGGPGIPNRHHLVISQKELGEEFTLVCWDQRGSGKSFCPQTINTSICVEDIVNDGVAVIDYLCQRFNQKSIYIVGQAWGSILGVLISKKVPDRVKAYIGTGQLADIALNETRCYEFILAEAKRRKDKRAIEKLKYVGRPIGGRYINTDDMELVASFLNKYGGVIYNKSQRFITSEIKAILKSREYKLGEIRGFIRGAYYSINQLWDEMTLINISNTVREMEVPVYILQGRHDHNADSQLAKQWFDRLNAPEKHWIWFENSAHSPYEEESKKWRETIVKQLKE